MFSCLGVTGPAAAKMLRRNPNPHEAARMLSRDMFRYASIAQEAEELLNVFGNELHIEVLIVGSPMGENPGVRLLVHTSTSLDRGSLPAAASSLFLEEAGADGKPTGQASDWCSVEDLDNRLKWLKSHAPSKDKRGVRRWADAAVATSPARFVQERVVPEHELSEMEVQLRARFEESVEQRCATAELQERQRNLGCQEKSRREQEEKMGQLECSLRELQLELGTSRAMAELHEKASSEGFERKFQAMDQEIERHRSEAELRSGIQERERLQYQKQQAAFEQKLRAMEMESETHFATVELREKDLRSQYKSKIQTMEDEMERCRYTAELLQKQHCDLQARQAREKDELERKLRAVEMEAETSCTAAEVGEKELRLKYEYELNAMKQEVEQHRGLADWQNTGNDRDYNGKGEKEASRLELQHKLRAMELELQKQGTGAEFREKTIRAQFECKISAMEHEFEQKALAAARLQEKGRLDRQGKAQQVSKALADGLQASILAIDAASSALSKARPFKP
eukprot:TRINITY_DN61896_c0_g1_i1.p1 TRINITY_DN61896_c0_g1~~TRINITY_DN61896_c0_g1_i1.p1  ORF type:complete len:544 (-),score=139.47 TRINITY_DN61896_c0_g1_i1:202-1740(-)